MSRAFALTLLLPALMLGGCVSIFSKPPPRIYSLEAGQVQPVAAAPVDAVLAIDEPEGDRTILGSELIIRDDNVYSVIGKSQWSMRAAEALQTLAAQTISRQNRFRSAVASGGARFDYEVRWNVLSFEVRRSGETWTAYMEADVRVVDFRRLVLASKHITKQQELPAADHRSGPVAHALEDIARQASLEISDFAAETVTADLARRAEEERVAAAQNQTARTPRGNPRRDVVRRSRR